MEIKPIGIIRTPFKQKFATPRQGCLAPSAQGRIELNATIPDGSLDGLNEFSHLWILFVFHKNNNSKIKGKVFPPRLRGESMGWAATRTPHRPNNIGMTLAQLLAMDDKTLLVRGVDLIDKTPIVDIKPYIPSYDRPTTYHQGWTGQIADTALKVQWSQKALDRIEEFSIPPQTLRIVEECLSQDPRPPSSKGKVFATMIDHWDFHFKIDNKTIEVFDIN